MPRITTRTARVIIRSPTIDDSAELTALARKSHDFHAGLVHPPSTARVYRAALERWSSDANEAFIIARKDDDRIVGMANFSQIYYGPLCSAYLGYWVGQPFAGNGYMTEGVALALNEAFGRMKLHRVEANLQPRNDPSRELVKRLGFRQEGFSPRYLKIGGRWRDHERWAILSDEWRGITASSLRSR